MEPTVNMDFIVNGAAQGEVAQSMQNNGRLDPAMLRPYLGKDGNSYITVCKQGANPGDPTSYQSIRVNSGATLRREEWNLLDESVLNVARYRLAGIADLESKGLVYNLNNAMGTTVLEYHDMSDAFEAELTMDGVTRSKGDRVNFGAKYLPIPIIHVDYEINARVLAASRSLGNALDTTQAEVAARKVAEKLEKMLFTSTSYTFGGGTIYSYVNHPHRNPVILTVQWNDTTSASSGDPVITGAKIIADVISMKQASIDDLHYGPWMLYIPTGYETVLDGDYDTTTPGTTIRERIMKIDGITGIKVIDTLTAHNVLLVQMTPDVVRLVKGMAIQNVEWQTEGRFINKYKVMTIQVPQIRSDYNERSGIVHLAASHS